MVCSAATAEQTVKGDTESPVLLCRQEHAAVSAERGRRQEIYMTKMFQLKAAHLPQPPVNTDIRQPARGGAQAPMHSYLKLWAKEGELLRDAIRNAGKRNADPDSEAKDESFNLSEAQLCALQMNTACTPALKGCIK